MKKVILLVLLMPYTASGQILENFETQDLSEWVQSIDGHWQADSLASPEGKFSLHHIFDNPNSGTDQIGIPINNLHPSDGIIRWSFIIRHGYDPSSSNSWAVFLMSDTEPDALFQDGNTRGFAVGVNLTGYDDTLRLWKVKDDILTPVINFNINWQADIGITEAVKLIVERSAEGFWSASAYRMDESLICVCPGYDSELFTIGWFEIYYRYSSSRDRLLWIDDITIEGSFYEDNIAPLIVSCQVTGENSLEIALNKLPSDEFLYPENFMLNDDEVTPLSVVKKEGYSYMILFSDNFINKSLNHLKINNICDVSGNCSTGVLVTFSSAWAEKGDIIISEIMADPEPVVSLPGKEYIEITNRTNYSFNLKNWKLTFDQFVSVFHEISIGPSEIIIICMTQDTSLFSKYGRVVGLKQFPALTDGGRMICLYDNSGNLVHGVEYSAGWYSNELKSTGGWSLEMIDTAFPFYYDGNWTASVSKMGGTPGSVNSATGSNPDNTFFGVINVFPDDSINITIRFSEPVFDLPEMVKSLKIGEQGIVAIHKKDSLYREFYITPETSIIKGVLYNLKIIDDLKDFAGNDILTSSFVFGLTERPGQSEILFNELLFNPFPGDPDYIEFYNSSDKVIDASRLQIISINDGTGDTSRISNVSDEKRCIIPYTYYAITTNRESITERYFSAEPDFLFETGSVPSMSDDKGHLILYNRELDLIDEVFYTEKMHSYLLSDNEGVALEKTRPTDKSSDGSNWHSASQSSGWGTPGARNSVYFEMSGSSDRVALSSSVISPDNDGYQDFLEINFILKSDNNIISVMIFDETGNYLKTIASNLLAGTESSVTWDGTTDDGTAVRTGVYIVFITLYDEKGKTDKWKKVCTVVRR